MLIIPAIDLKDGECVRLRQGDMNDSTVFATNPLAAATRWVDAGCKRLHLVDLNGAFAGKPVNAEAVKSIAHNYPSLPMQIGGGIRTLENIEFYLRIGVRYAIIGTAAVKNPEFVADACRAFPGRIIVGIDAREGKVATDGWAETTEVPAIELAKKCEAYGVSAIIYTDIARDGMMQGVNIASTMALAESTSVPIIASGGMTNMQDVRNLWSISHLGILGAIAGRSLYEGTLNLSEAQTFCDQNR